MSRERVGTEVLGMLQGAGPMSAVVLLGQYGLYPSLFPLPESLLICASEDGEGATPAADVTFEFSPACECAQAINAYGQSFAAIARLSPFTD